MGHQIDGFIIKFAIKLTPTHQIAIKLPSNAIKWARPGAHANQTPRREPDCQIHSRRRGDSESEVRVPNGFDLLEIAMGVHLMTRPIK